MAKSLHRPVARVRRVVLPLLAAAAMSACTHLSTRPATPATGTATPNGAVIVKPQPLTPSETRESDLMYDVLAGEMAGQSGDLTLAAESYLKAARLSDDPDVAERGLRIALFAKNEAAALELAQRWVQLAPDNPQAHEALAVLSLRAGKTADAGDQLVRFVASASDKTAAFAAVTELLSHEPDRQAALAVMKTLADANPKVPDAHLAYARLALQAGKRRLSLSQVQRAIALRPNWTDAEILRAQVRSDMGELGTASRELGAAVKRRPKDLDLRMAYARVLVRAGDLKSAQREFEVLARQAPGNADVQYSLGLLALEARRLDAARRYFRKVLDLGERQDEARYYLGRIAEEQNKLNTAKDWYSRVNEGEYWLDAQVRVAQIAAREGRVAEARRQLATLRKDHPQAAVQLYAVEGEMLSQVGRNRQALDVYNHALKDHPDNTDLLYGRSLVADKLGKLKLAERDLRAIIKQQPDNAVALNALGYTLADRTTRYAEALVYIKKAIKLKPNDPAVIDSLGWVQYRLGNTAAALKALHRAYKMSGDAEIAAHLGEVLWTAGHHDEARAVWRKALKAHPDSAALKRVIDRFKP